MRRAFCIYVDESLYILINLNSGCIMLSYVYMQIVCMNYEFASGQIRQY